MAGGERGRVDDVDLRHERGVVRGRRRKGGRVRGRRHGQHARRLGRDLLLEQRDVRLVALDLETEYMFRHFLYGV